MAWQRARIPCPEDLTPSQREAYANELIDIIRNRSESGYGVKPTGEGDWRKYRFPGYSKSYTESLDFKIAGKSAGRVDLSLSGDMLAALDVLSTSPGSVMIGYENGTEENDRAEGNQKGSYGGSPNERKARAFLGATKAEQREALERIGYGEGEDDGGA